MSQRIQVWVKDTPGEPCHQCDVTTQYLERNRIPFTTKGLSEATPEQMDEFRSIGQSAPVVLTEKSGAWAGLRPDKLREVKMAHRSAQAEPPTAPVGMDHAMPALQQHSRLSA